MADLVHKYYCQHCRQYVFGATSAVLAVSVNNHNSTLHPAAYAGWQGSSIQESSCYSGPKDLPAQVEARAVHSVEWGDAKNPPSITAEDRQMLARGKVRW